MAKLQKIVPSFWYAKDAEKAAAFYAAIFPDSQVDNVTTMPIETPSGPAGSVVMVDFTLMGQKFFAMTAGKLDDFNHAVSFSVLCDSQAEIDRYWDALMQDGGKPEECGWLRDKYGVAWQIMPRQMLEEWSFSDDVEARKRGALAMMKMVKLDMATLQAAYEGKNLKSAA